MEPKVLREDAVTRMKNGMIFEKLIVEFVEETDQVEAGGIGGRETILKSRGILQ